MYTEREREKEAAEEIETDRDKEGAKQNGGKRKGEKMGARGRGRVSAKKAKHERK